MHKLEIAGQGTRDSNHDECAFPGTDAALNGALLH